MITKLSLILSLLGIITLLILANITEPEQINIKDITIKDVNKKAKIQGEVVRIKSYEKSNFQIIKLKDSSGEIEITTNKILDLKNNQELIIIGRITQYKNSLQIQAEKIMQG